MTDQTNLNDAAGGVRASLIRKRDRVHPSNRRDDLPMQIKLTFGDLETIIAALALPPVEPADGGEARGEYISPDLAEVAGLVSAMHTKWMQREELMRQEGGFELMERMANLMDGIVDAVPNLQRKLFAAIAKGTPEPLPAGLEERAKGLRIAAEIAAGYINDEDRGTSACYPAENIERDILAAADEWSCEREAQRLYEDYVGSHPTVSSSEFRTWKDLSPTGKSQWLNEAAAIRKALSSPVAEMGVTQADRDAAAAFVLKRTDNPYSEASILDGKRDDSDVVQAFRQHRLNHRPMTADVAWLIERRVSPPQWAVQRDPTGVGAFYSDIHRAHRFPSKPASSRQGPRPPAFSTIVEAWNTRVPALLDRLERAEKARDEVIEECAGVAETGHCVHIDRYTEGRDRASRDIATAIRALKASLK